MQRTLIGQLSLHADRQVRIMGMLETLRAQKRMQFIVLRDRSGAVQAVHDRNASEEISGLIANLTPGSFVSITGRVLNAPQVKLGGIEVRIEALEVVSLAETPLPIAEDSALEKQIDWRQVSLRTPKNLLVFSVQTTLEHAMRRFWHEHGFLEIHSPKLMGTASESGAEVFKVKYFDTTAYLAQSPQFYKQMAMAAGFERVFEIGPAFRAEPSFTTRHETEFTSVDMEIAWISSHEDVMRLEEEWLVYALGEVKKAHGAEIESLFGVEVVVPSAPFPRLTLEQARRIVEERGHPIGHKPDLDPEGERIVSAHVKEAHGHEFCFITDYPASVRAFYHMRHDDRPDLTKGFDLLWKGLEITTGAQREHRYDRLAAQAVDRGYALEPLQDYLNFFRYGCPPHGGMGVGLSRLLVVMLGLSSIREATFLSRTPNRLTP